MFSYIKLLKKNANVNYKKNVFRKQLFSAFPVHNAEKLKQLVMDISKAKQKQMIKRKLITPYSFWMFYFSVLSDYETFTFHPHPEGKAADVIYSEPPRSTMVIINR